MFNENSGLVTIWVNLIQSGVYKEENIPVISNLKEMVLKVLSKQ